MAKPRYNRKLLLKALAELDRQSSEVGLSTLTLRGEAVPLDVARAVRDWQYYIVQHMVRGELPDLGVVPGLALVSSTPKDDHRRKVLDFARHALMMLPEAGRLRGSMRQGEEPAALQIVSGTWGAEARINGCVRGCLIAWVWQPPLQGSQLRLELLWELPKSERDGTTHYTIINGLVGEEAGHWVFHNSLPSVIRRASAKQLVSRLERSIAVPGARVRWEGLRPDVDPEEIRSALFEVAREGVHPGEMGTRIVDLLDQSARCGKPGRKSPVRLVSTEELAPGLDPPDESLGPEDRIAIREALSKVDAKTQEILRRSAEGESEAAIAKDLGVTQQAVNKRLQAARAALRKLLS